MYYLIGLTPEEAAELKNKQIAKRNGCNGNITDGFGLIIKHLINDEWAIQIPDEYAAWLNSDEVNNLITEEQAIEYGWIE